MAPDAQCPHNVGMTFRRRIEKKRQPCPKCGAESTLVLEEDDVSEEGVNLVYLGVVGPAKDTSEGIVCTQCMEIPSNA